MAIDERSRHDLYVRLEGLLGPEPASTLMEHLPPVGWADVATKRDLQVLADQMNQRFETLEWKLLATFRGELQTALTSQTRQLTITLFGAVFGAAGTIGALAFAAARLT